MKAVKRFLKDVFWLVVFAIAFICILLVIMAWASPDQTKQLLTCVLGGC